MTRNQIEFLSLQETKRHQRVAEAQNELDIGVKSKTQQEQERHNRATEAQAVNELYENVLHNRRTESINEKHYATVDPETIRHNKMSEQIEAVKARASIINAGASQSSAAAALQQASTMQQRQVEDARHNRAAEVLTGFQNANSWLQANAAGRQATAALSNAETNAKAQRSQETRNNFLNAETITKGIQTLVPIAAGLAKVLI